MKNFFFRILLLGIAAISSQSTFAQHAAPPLDQCPAPLIDGPWVVGEGAALAFGRAYTQYIPIAPSGQTVQGEVILGDCSDSEFTFKFEHPDMGLISAEMSVADWANNEGVLYSGSSPTAYGSVSLMWTIGNSHQATGISEFIFPRGSGQATIPVVMQSTQPTTDDNRYECRCKSELAGWINEQVMTAEEFRSAYANPDYYERPNGVASKHWDAMVYDDMISFIVGRGMSRADAAEAAVDIHFPDAEQGTSNTGNSADSGTDIVASTNVDSCVITYTNAHRTSCFPAIEHEATVVHETHHRKACFARGIDGANSIADEGREEAEAYQAEIDFLSNFIEQNC